MQSFKFTGSNAWEAAVPDSLDIAKQRKLVEDLKRVGQNTDDAETRLRDMLNFLTSVRCAPGFGSRLAHKGRHHPSDSSES
jgi:hypothetical protein